MRMLVVLFFALLFSCGTPAERLEPAGPDRWSGTYRYGGTRTELRREGRFYTFSDARLGGFRFRLMEGGFLEDDTRSRPVRVFPNVQDDVSKTDRPYRSLRMSWVDEDWILIRVP